MNKLVSIIIPVYNAAHYIEECLDSILSQSYKKFEVVLINDGSTDNSLEICKEYLQIDSRIQLINTDNKGVSNARNVGIDNASGDYIAFIDSDDTVSVDYIDVMVKHAMDKSFDIVCCNIAQWSPRSNTITRFPDTYNSSKITEINHETAIELMLRNRLISSGPYAKLFNAKKLGLNRFSSLVIAEDLEFNFRLFNESEKILHIDQDLYYYRQNPEGAMRKQFTPTRMDAIKATQLILDYATHHNTSYKKAARYRLLRAALHCGGSILDSHKAVEYKNLYCQCIRIIRKSAPTVLFDKKADIKMRMISCLASLHLPLAWRMMSSWHKVDASFKSKAINPSTER